MGTSVENNTKSNEVKQMKVVVVGQGYVGLPLAARAVEAGHQVVGVDLDRTRVAELNQGRSRVDDVSDQQLSAMLSKGYRASYSESEYRDAEVIVICVPTPLGEDQNPDLAAVKGAIRAIAGEVQAGTLVVLESTTYPGTTASEVAPRLVEKGYSIGEDVFLAYSPERIDPGNSKYGVKNTPKVVGADDAESLRRAVEFYGSFINEVVSVSGTAEAELTKLLENTYRHINIGLVNELSIVCHELEIDVWEVINAAATKPFGFQAFYPGPGVGGHCIPIDPNYLNHRVRQVLGRPFRFVELAEGINSSMPSYVVSRTQDILNESGLPLNGREVLLVGVTYKSGIADTRKSPATAVAKLLLDKGAIVSYYDPKVEQWGLDDGRLVEKVDDVFEASRGNDITILLQEIKGVSPDELAETASILFDTRGVTDSAKAIKL